MRAGAVRASARPIKRSFRIAGHATSISLEAAFWDVLKEAALARSLSLAQLVAEIDGERGETNLSSAVRVWLLAYARTHPLVRPPSS